MLADHILKIGSNNEYDNNYVFSLDAALGNRTYVDAWRYAGNALVTLYGGRSW